MTCLSIYFKSKDGYPAFLIGKLIITDILLKKMRQEFKVKEAGIFRIDFGKPNN